jgi:hypothetical protein
MPIAKVDDEDDTPVVSPLEMSKGLQKAGLGAGTKCDYCNREAITECNECEAYLCIDCQREHVCEQ